MGATAFYGLRQAQNVSSEGSLGALCGEWQAWGKELGYELQQNSRGSQAVTLGIRSIEELKGDLGSRDSPSLNAVETGERAREGES